MSEIISRRKTCRLCNGTDHSLIVHYPPSPMADAYVQKEFLNRTQDSYPLDLFLCTQCGHSQLLDIIDPNIIYLDYIYVTTSSLGLSDHFRRNAKATLAKINLPSDGFVIDIGSNDGTLLQAYKDEGKRVLGVEPSREASRIANESGVQTIPEFFDTHLAKKIRSEHGPADIITMNNLFANIDDLQDATKGIRSLLKPDGVFIFETFYFADFINNLVFDFMYHEHLSYFTVKPLREFFDRHEMELIEVESIPTKGGSMRCTVQLKGGKRRIDASVGDRIEQEKRMGIHQNGPLFKEFTARIDRQKHGLNDFLSAQKKQGKVIAGFGASATTTTLLYYCDSIQYFDFLIDDNLAKQNTYSPGCHLPVLSADSLQEKKPDVVVLLAWRYAESLMSKHSALKKPGVTVVVPFPEFRIVK